MTSLFALAVFVIAAAATIAWLKAQLEPAQGEWPYYAKKPLSAPEQVLYWRLNEALPNHIVLAQVALSQLLGVKNGPKKIQWHNRISQLTADFVVCTRDSSVVAVVELDDSSHDAPRRKQTDMKKDNALSAAGIKVIRWNVKELPNAAQIVAELAAQPGAPADAPALRAGVPSLAPLARRR